MILLLKPTLIVTPDEVIKNSGIYIDTETGKIITISQNFNLHHDFEVNFPEETIAFPALINSHDHLLGTYWPKVGEGPHITWKTWDDQLKASLVYAERGKIPNLNLYMLGAYKNILSGVTTVMDHIPHKINEVFLPQLPLRSIQRYGLSHEASSYDLKWGDGIEIEHQRAAENNWPYVTHIEEGFDDESLRGVDNLIDANALDNYSVLVHGLALSDADILRIARAEANLIWCPASNIYMFRTTARVREWIDAGVNISLGTDSTMSGSLNILEEMKLAKKAFFSKYGYKLDDRLLTFMVTKNPAKALRLDHKLGHIKPHYNADILIMKLKNRNNPYTSLTQAKMNDIELLFNDGKPIYGYTDYDLLFQKLMFGNYTTEKIHNKDRLIVGNLGRLMREVWTSLGFKKKLPFIPIK